MISRTAYDIVPASLGTDAYPLYLDIHVLAAAASASAVWPAANLCIFNPLYVNTAFTAKQFWIGNGAAVSGNFDLGLYTEAGVKMASTGSTAQAGTTAPQGVTITGGLFVPRGRYWFGIAFDNGVAQVRRWTGVANLGNINSMMGSAQMTGTFPLPSTITFAACSQNFVALFGLSQLSLTM